MAEVTWKATLIGALMLFLIGMVVATCLNYASASIQSIKAGLDGPFDCKFSFRRNASKKCSTNEEGKCIFIFVSYKDEDEIKLSLSYVYDRKLNMTSPYRIIFRNESEIPAGKCSAEYCGAYSYKKKNSNDYKDHPELVKTVDEAEKNNNGTIQCFLNPWRPKDGAFVKLNHDVGDPQDRMFRYYEAWIILVVPIAVLLVILVSLCILFFRGDLAASPVQRPKEIFVPPGHQPTLSAQCSLQSGKSSPQPVHI